MRFLTFSILFFLIFIHRYYVSRAIGEPLAETENPLLENQSIHNKESEEAGGLVYYSDNDKALRKSEFEHRNSGSAGFYETYQYVKEVYSQIMIPSLSVIGIFSVTIAIFPSLTVLVESTEKCKSSDRFYNDLFSPFLFLMFNVFDLIGRLVAGSTKPVFTPSNIWIGSVSRLIFWPAFLLLNVANSKLPVAFPNDAFPILFMAVMAFTNGYIASNCMMMGASIVKPQDSGLAGTIMVFSLTLGLFFGSCFSFMIVYISQGKV